MLLTSTFRILLYVARFIFNNGRISTVLTPSLSSHGSDWLFFSAPRLHLSSLLSTARCRSCPRAALLPAAGARPPCRLDWVPLATGRRSVPDGQLWPLSETDTVTAADTLADTAARQAGLDNVSLCRAPRSRATRVTPHGIAAWVTLPGHVTRLVLYDPIATPHGWHLMFAEATGSEANCSGYQCEVSSRNCPLSLLEASFVEADIGSLQGAGKSDF